MPQNSLAEIPHVCGNRPHGLLYLAVAGNIVWRIYGGVRAIRITRDAVRALPTSGQADRHQICRPV